MSEAPRRDGASGSFDENIDWAVGPNGVREFEAGSDWAQGRAAFGGLVAAGAVNATSALVPAEHRLRSVMVTFLRPLGPGAAACRAEVIREGRSTTFAEAEVVQDGKVCARVHTTSGSTRSTQAQRFDAVMPSVPSPDDLSDTLIDARVGPRFLQFFRFRWVDGSMPMTGGSGDRILGWWKLRTPVRSGSPGAIVGIVDAWPAPTLGSMRLPAQASSVTWSIDLSDAVDLYGLTHVNDWLLFEGRTIFSDDGYTSFDATVWSRDGRALIASRQLVAVF